MIGVICTLIMVMSTFVFAAQRFDVLVTHGDQVIRENTDLHPDPTKIIQIQNNRVISEDTFEFGLKISIAEYQDSVVSQPKDFDRFGTLHAVQYKTYFDEAQ